MCVGPGPKYKLRTLVGYEEHCLSRHRGPAYTIRPRTELHKRSIGPGPQYDVSRLTKYGADNPPAYTIAAREPFRCRYIYSNTFPEDMKYALLNVNILKTVPFVINIKHELKIFKLFLY